MFVYSKTGKIYISTKRNRTKFDHSSLVGGEEVIVAGSMEITRGYLKFITDVSSRYVTTTKDNLKAVVYRLKVMGADISKMRVFFQTNY